MRLMRYLGHKAVFFKRAHHACAIVMATAALWLAAPQPAAALQIAPDTPPVVFQSNMETLYDALLEVANGQYVLFGNLAVPPISQTMTPAIAKIQADLNGGPAPHMPVDEFLQRILDATGGNEPWSAAYRPNYLIDPNQVDADRVQNPQVLLKLLNNILSGNAQATVSLAKLHLEIPYAFLEPCADCVPTTTYANGGTSETFPTPDAYSGYLYSRAQRLASYMIAGSRGVAQMTLRAATQSSPPAQNVLTVLSSRGTDSGLTVLQAQNAPPQCSVQSLSTQRLRLILADMHGGEGALQAYLIANYNNAFNAPLYYQDILTASINANGTQRNLMNEVFAGRYDPLDPSFNSYFGVYTYYWDQSDELLNANLVPSGLMDRCLNPLASQWAYYAQIANTPGSSAFTPPTTQPPTTAFNELELPDPTNDNFNGADDPGDTYSVLDPFISDEEPTPPDSALDDCRNKSGQDSIHPLGDFNKDPCTWTRDNQSIGYAQEHQAGWYFMNYLTHWWETEYLPSLKEMTAQLSAQITDQTMKLGAAKDALMMKKTARAIQKTEVEIKKNVQPSEGACVVGSFNSLSSTTTRAGNALAKGFTADAGKAIGGAPTVVGDQQAPATAPNPRGKSAHFRQRFNDYCSYANDDDANNGNNICDIGASEINVTNNSNPDGTQTSTPTPDKGVVTNGDIDIEGFLLQDTIVLSEPQNQALASAMLSNLVQPFAEDAPDDEVVKLSSTQENILDRQHVKALKKVAAEVIGSMFSRRAAVPLPPAYLRTSNTGSDTSGAIDLGQPPDCGGTNPDGTAQPACQTTPGSSGSFDQLLAKIRQREASGSYSAFNVYGYMGGYQMGEQALIGAGAIKRIPDTAGQNRISMALAPATPPIPQPYTAGNTFVKQGYRKHPQTNVPGTYNVRFSNYVWLPSTGITTNAQFLSSPALQDRLYKVYLKSLWSEILSKGMTSYIGQSSRGVVITASGILIGSHLIGAGGMRKFLSGKSPGTDANGTTAISYIKLFNGYDVSPITGNSYIAPTPTVALTGDLSTIPNTDTVENDPGTEVNVAKMIRGIREKAGVPPEQINDAPSYNEIMLAMTKERFFNPKYFTNLAADLTQIKQEQASVNAYITIQLQDIYKLQEQINALLAARASVKLGTTFLPDHMDLTDVRENMYEP